MPTKKKRVGFIPRDDVMKIIDILSVENNLSNSKIISILVEEALSLRGIFNIKTGKINQSYGNINEAIEDLSDLPVNFKDNQKFKINIQSGTHKKSDATNLLKQKNHQSLDFYTYKKFISFLKFQEIIDELNS